MDGSADDHGMAFVYRVWLFHLQGSTGFNCLLDRNILWSGESSSWRLKAQE